MSDKSDRSRGRPAKDDLISQYHGIGPAAVLAAALAANRKQAESKRKKRSSILEETA